MPATKYTYAIATDFSSGVDIDSLEAEIAASSITTALDRIDSDGTNCDIWFASALLTAEKTTLDNDVSPPTGGSIIGDHAGTAPTEIVFHAASKLVEGEVVITQDATWQLLGGVITQPAFFTSNLAAVIGRVSAGVKTSGTTIQLKVTEDDGTTEADLVTAPQTIPDTAGAWQNHNFSTDVAPRIGNNTYCLWGRLNGSASASVRFVSMSLLEVV